MVRKITELGKLCDVLAVADYEVIPVAPDPTLCRLVRHLARNQMVLMYTPSSKFAGEINSENWHGIPSPGGCPIRTFGPGRDPAPDIALLLWQLAEKYYQKPGLYEQLNKSVPPRNIRPKSVELVTLLQTGELDYVYGYRSVADQSGLSCVTLPPEIDLSDSSKAGLYSTVSTQVAGNKPGEKRR